MLKLKELRKLRGLTQEQLGDLVGASKASISFYESGRQEPSLDMIKRFADVLEVSTDSILGYETEQINDEYIPKTEESRLLVVGIDHLPKEQREQAVDVMRAMFKYYSDYFEKKESNNEPKP